MVELISIQECMSILERYGQRDNAADLQLVRYYVTPNEFIIKIRYKDCEFRCVVDKLDFADGKISGVNNIEEFTTKYLAHLPANYLMEIEGEEPDITLKITTSVENGR